MCSYNLSIIKFSIIVFHTIVIVWVIFQNNFLNYNGNRKNKDLDHHYRRGNSVPNKCPCGISSVAASPSKNLFREYPNGI